MAQDFIVELGTEELPPTALKDLMNAFTNGIIEGLHKNKLAYASAKGFASPRRLAVIISALEEKTPLDEALIWGPPLKVAFDKDGNPTRAAEAFAAKNGVQLADLAHENDGKVDKLLFRTQVGGDQATGILPQIISDSLDQLPIPKRMRWGANRTQFVRPVHWLVMMYGGDVVNAEILGLQSSNTTLGHRFHFNQKLVIDNAQKYLSLLKDQGKVIADYDERKQMIREQVETQAKNINGVAQIDEDLLEEVTSLVEWPVAITGNFDKTFLEVPQEALISSMQEHQKYFPVFDENGSLLPNFITVSNIDSKNIQQVIDGNERVIRPRLSDAAFFFETDKKTSLYDFRERLKTVVFQAKLGSVYDKTERVSQLASKLSNELDCDQRVATEAAKLCKADLVSSMVGEFDKMQGIAGAYYARNQGLSDEIATGIQEHYLPKYAGDDLPESMPGCIVAICDRIDTITGILGLGQKPTGSKDPFALRRASVSVLRLIIEKDLNIDLQGLLEASANLHGETIDRELAVTDGISYILDRLRNWYDEKGISFGVYESVLSLKLTRPSDVDRRIQAVNQFVQRPEAAALAAANKRVSNILAKQDSSAFSGEFDTSLFSEDEERALSDALMEVRGSFSGLLAKGDYISALNLLAGLRDPVDQFFDKVMVMVDDTTVRNNRLRLLSSLRAMFLDIADISYLASAN